MGLFEAMVLLAIGLLTGIIATVFDVLVFGYAAFASHISLWVFTNAVFSVHAGSRKSAMLWSIPLNFGFIECYFMTTAATYEGYPKSLVVPLAAVAIISPLLSYALWTAKREQTVYTRVLTLLVAAGTLVTCYVLNGEIAIYDMVLTAATAVLLLFLPVRQYDIKKVPRKEWLRLKKKEEAAHPRHLATSTSDRKSSWGAPAATDETEANTTDEQPGAIDTADVAPRDVPHHDAESTRRDAAGRDAARRDAARRDAGVTRLDVDKSVGSREKARPTKRRKNRKDNANSSVRMKFTSRRRRRELADQEAREREERIRATAERRERSDEDDANDNGGYGVRTSALGKARTGRRSVRN